MDNIILITDVDGERLIFWVHMQADVQNPFKRYSESAYYKILNDFIIL